MVDEETTITEVFNLMKKYDISQFPVTQDGEISGSVTARGILSALVDGADAHDTPVSQIKQETFPFVSIQEKVKDISKLINKSNSAVLVKDIAGSVHIITEYDLINAMSK